MTHSLIVGGTKGLGREVTKLLLDRGDNVSVISRSGANKNDDFFKKASCYELDIEKIENISELVDEIYKNNGPINCPRGPISEKAVVIVLNTSSVPAVGSRAKKNTNGKMANPANSATAVSAVTTTTEAFPNF